MNLADAKRLKKFEKEKGIAQENAGRIPALKSRN